MMEQPAAQPLEKPSVNSIDTVLGEMQSWRESKQQGDGNRNIPDALWLKIFALEAKHDPTTLRRIFQVNSKQYQIRHAALISTNKQSKKNDQPETAESMQTKMGTPESPFCQVNIKTNSNDPIPALTKQPSAQKAVSTLRSQDQDPQTYLDYNTLIVELIRPDGYRLNIHATNESLKKIFNAFCIPTGAPS